MKLIKHLCILLFLTILIQPDVALSQANKPKPPDRMKMLGAFNGTWQGEMEVKKEKKTVKYKLTHTSEKIVSGWGIQITELAQLPDKRKYQAAKIFSSSSVSDSTYMYSIDNFGETWFYIGTWETNKKLVLRSKMDLNGKVTEKVITYTFVNTKKYDYKSITKITGTPDETVEMSMSKTQ